MSGLLFVGVALAQTGSETGQVNVTISDTSLQVSPSSVNLTAGTPFTLVVDNTSAANTYSLVVEQAGAVNQPIQAGGQPARVDNIAPGQTQTSTWTIDTPGSYQFAAYTSTNATTASNLVATFNVAASTAATSTATAATETPAATATTEVMATSAATATEVATATTEPTATGAVTATGTISGTAEATLPQTGGTDDSLPMSLALITFGALLAVGGLIVGRKLARR
jgi:LPXTG-motif cell wall-anchored protein